MAILELSGLSKSYEVSGTRTDVLDDINVSVEEGEFVAILGFSGAGKTTLVSLLAGLEQADAGGVIYKGVEVTEPDASRGVVFQSYSLMPWLSVVGNIELAVNTVAKGLSRSERAARVTKYIDMVGLSHARDRRPAELSGGMRQRVSVARALATEPEVLLLDEPLSALDALTRARLQDEFAEISKVAGATIVLITNDVDEALLLADRVVCMTPAPKATFGRMFDVSLARPRVRAEMNHDAEYIRLRGDITRYMMSLAEARDESASVRELPNVVPISFTKKPAGEPAQGQLNKTAMSDAPATQAVARGQVSAGGEAPVPSAVVEAGRSARTDDYLRFSDLGKTYPTPDGPLTVVEGFELTMRKGEFVTLIGHSGCGKSTVLSMTAGLNPISHGGIVLDGLHVLDAGPERAVVFQSPSLMPWLTAYENVALGVERVYPKASRGERKDVVGYYLERVGLGDAMHRRASELSNGMQQRVGIARAFALSPKLLLLDEPFGMLDSLTRWQLQDVLMDVWSRTEVTTVCVTHDVDEAILLADRVVMMSNGPQARVGNIMEVDLPRPRSRDALLAHPDYYAYREELLEFLEAYEGGANPPADVLEAITARRTERIARRNTSTGEPVPSVKRVTDHVDQPVGQAIADSVLGTVADAPMEKRA